MSSRRYVFLWIMLIVFSVYMGACKATVGGSKGGGNYELKRSLTMPNSWEVIVKDEIRPVYNAVISGINDLGLKIRASKVDGLSGMVEGVFADNKSFNITLSYESPAITLIRIKTGLTGDKNLSVQLFRAIEKYI